VTTPVKNKSLNFYVALSDNNTKQKFQMKFRSNFVKLILKCLLVLNKEINLARVLGVFNRASPVFKQSVVPRKTKKNASLR
jgi:hypothetical protein